MEQAIRLFRDTREWLAPIPTETAFLERGVLTPEEFVKAGDHLVSCCPSWSWSEGEFVKSKDFLPQRKQFLVTRGVPCVRRVSNLELTSTDGGGGGEGEEDNIGDWQIPTLNESKPEAIEAGVDFAQKECATEDYIDMEDGELVLDDSVQKPITAIIEGGRGGGTRRYDLSITYDKYYQTPRIWLFGWNSSGSPLSPDEMFEDVFQDYVKKTVTIDPHPHLSQFHASVHPCKHAPVMKSMIDHLVESNQVPSIDQYLFLFLKLIQSIVPTIEYDYTVNVHVKKQSAT